MPDKKKRYISGDTDKLQDYFYTKLLFVDFNSVTRVMFDQLKKNAFEYAYP